jgi:hypothetical protein
MALAGDLRPGHGLDPGRPGGDDRRRDRQPPVGEGALGISTYQVAVGGTFYIIGAAVGALFYAIATGVGGAVGPLLFGKLLGGDDPSGVAVGYWIAAGLMALAAVVEVAFGVDAEQRSLEELPSRCRRPRRPGRPGRGRS